MQNSSYFNLPRVFDTHPQDIRDLVRPTNPQDIRDLARPGNPQDIRNLVRPGNPQDFRDLVRPGNPQDFRDIVRPGEPQGFRDLVRPERNFPDFNKDARYRDPSLEALRAAFTAGPSHSPDPRMRPLEKSPLETGRYII